jgi:AraC family transcriptional regulator, ethanolamine operon transcriptional activator
MTAANSVERTGFVAQPSSFQIRFVDLRAEDSNSTRSVLPRPQCFWCPPMDIIEGLWNEAGYPTMAKVSVANVSTFRLTDPNQYKSLSNWDLDFRQIEAGPMETRLAVRAGRSMTVLGSDISRSVHQVGASPPDLLTLGFPINCSMARWHGKEVDGPCLLSYGFGDEFDGVSQPGNRGFVFSLSRQAVTVLADRLGIAMPDTIRRSVPIPLTRSPFRLVRLAGIARGVLSPYSGTLDTNAEEDIIRQLLLAITDASCHEDQSTTQKRTRAVEKALTCLEDTAAEIIPISRLCAETGVSWRTLDRGFQERFGIGPKAYHTRLRLSRVRTEILDQGPHCVISDVANKWGFWHMGKFARDYKDLFSELPSETRRG